MSTRIATIQIDEEHSRAICAEIGDRLRIALGEPLPIPPNLARLIERLSELDHHDSPSLVPSIESVSPPLGSAPTSMVCALLEGCRPQPPDGWKCNDTLRLHHGKRR